jgi:hypothetical protein
MSSIDKIIENYENQKIEYVKLFVLSEPVPNQYGVTFKKHELGPIIYFTEVTIYELIITILIYEDIDMLTSIFKKKRVKKNIINLTNFEKTTLLIQAINFNNELLFCKIVDKLNINFDIFEETVLIITRAIKSNCPNKLIKVLERINRVISDSEKYMLIIKSINSNNIIIINIIINKFFSDNFDKKKFFIHNLRWVKYANLNPDSNKIFTDQFIEPYNKYVERSSIFESIIRSKNLEIISRILEVFYYHEPIANNFNMYLYVCLAMKFTSIEILGLIFMTCQFKITLAIVSEILFFSNITFNTDGVSLSFLMILNKISNKIKNEKCQIYSHFELNKFMIKSLNKIQDSKLDETNRLIYEKIREDNLNPLLTLCNQYSIKYITKKSYRDKVDSFLKNENLMLELDLSHYKEYIDTKLIKNAFELHLTGCQSIKNVSCLANVNTLDLSCCQNINNIDALCNVKHLNLNQCMGIYNVDALSSVNTLCLYKCKNIQNFSKLYNVDKLYLSKCQITFDVKTYTNLIII